MNVIIPSPYFLHDIFKVTSFRYQYFQFPSIILDEKNDSSFVSINICLSFIDRLNEKMLLYFQNYRNVSSFEQTNMIIDK
jgi:hypothetical protein